MHHMTEQKIKRLTSNLRSVRKQRSMALLIFNKINDNSRMINQTDAMFAVSSFVKNNHNIGIQNHKCSGEGDLTQSYSR